MKIIIKTQKNWVIAITSGKFKSNKIKSERMKLNWDRGC